MKTYTYTDSESGTQKKEFDTLSALIKYIENFGFHGDSYGVILQDGDPVIEYVSKETGITWRKAGGE